MLVGLLNALGDRLAQFTAYMLSSRPKIWIFPKSQNVLLKFDVGGTTTDMKNDF